MAVEELKRWHWVVIGGIVGFLLAYAWASTDGGMERVRSVEQRDFERDLVLKDEKTGEPLIRDIVIHPPQETYDGKKLVYVTYDRLHVKKSDPGGRRYWLTKKLDLTLPFKPVVPGRVADDTNLTVEKYLGEVRKENNFVSYQYGWWLAPRNAMLLGTIAGMLVVGGVWPSLLNIMIGAGFGRKPDPEAKEKRKKDPRYRLKWFKRADAGDKPPATKAAAADQDELHDVARAYERDLQDAGVSMTGGGAMPDPAHHDAAPSPRKLDGGPLQEAAAIKQPGDDDEIEVKGEYYPVLIHHKKKGDHDEEASADPHSHLSEEKP